MPNGGTPAGTSSPASSSSLLNRLQLDDDIDGETRDLFVTVDDPKKHVCTMETYITYRITTKVGFLTLSGFILVHVFFVFVFGQLTQAMVI